MANDRELHLQARMLGWELGRLARMKSEPKRPPAPPAHLPDWYGRELQAAYHLGHDGSDCPMELI